MKTATILLTLAVAGSALAADPATDRLANDLRALSRVADVAKDLEQQRQVLLAILDDEIEQLRGAKGDGTYRWADLQREEAGRKSEEQSVEIVSTETNLQKASVSAPRAYRLLVAVPNKRNLISGNNRVFVRSAVVDWTSFEGKSERTEIPVDVWVNPGDSHSIALPGIAKSAKASVALGVESGSKKAVAQVVLLEAKLVDRQENPYYPAVRRLLDLRSRAAEDRIRRGDFKAAVDEALLALPGELDKRLAEQAHVAAERKALAESGQTKGTIAIGDATPDVVNAMREINRLMGGSLTEQGEARAQLEALVMKLSPAARPQQ